MCESLTKLVDIGTFNILQDKLEDWLDNFKFNTCDQNVACGCEIIEMNAKIQAELFKLLSLCASEGGVYGGASVIKSRLLPILGQGFFSAGFNSNSSFKELGENNEKKKNLKDIKQKYKKTLDDFESDLKESQSENETLKLELEEAKIELDRLERQSSSEKMFDTQEIQVLKDQLNSIKSENKLLKSRTQVTRSHEPLDQLKDEVALWSSSHRDLHELQSSRCLSPHHHSTCDPCHYTGCSLDSCCFYVDHCDTIYYAKEQHLVSRLNDLFSKGRPETMNTLRRFSDDDENNKKVIFHVVMESFNIAKSAFQIYKTRIRTDQIEHHNHHNIHHHHHPGCNVEESVQHYINIHADRDLEVSTLCREVIRALDFKVPLIRRPSGLSFDIIGSFIRDTCKIAWDMCSLPIPLDVYHPASEGELFDESRYRRSYDSDFRAVFVYHHVWPCLIKNGNIIAKGEAVTKRAGSRSKSPRSFKSSTLSNSLNSGYHSLQRSEDLSPTNLRSKSPTSSRLF